MICDGKTLFFDSWITTVSMVLMISVSSQNSFWLICNFGLPETMLLRLIAKVSFFSGSNKYILKIESGSKPPDKLRPCSLIESPILNELDSSKTLITNHYW